MLRDPAVQAVLLAVVVQLQSIGACAPTVTEPEPPNCDQCPNIYAEMCNGQQSTCACTCPTTADALFGITRDDAADECLASYTCPGTTRAVTFNGATRTVQPAGTYPQLTCADPGPTWVDTSGNTITTVTCADECVYCPLAALYKPACNGINSLVCYDQTMVTLTNTRVDATPGCTATLTCPANSELYGFTPAGMTVFIDPTTAMFPCTDATGTFTSTASPAPNGDVTGVTCGSCLLCPNVYRNNCNGLGRMTCPDQTAAMAVTTRETATGDCTLTAMCPVGTDGVFFPANGDPPDLIGAPFEVICAGGMGQWEVMGGYGTIVVDAVTCASAT